MTDIQALAKELNQFSAAWTGSNGHAMWNQETWTGRVLEIAETFAARILELEAEVETVNRYRDAVAGRKNHYKDLNRQCQLRNMELAREITRRTDLLKAEQGFLFREQEQISIELNAQIRALRATNSMLVAEINRYDGAWERALRWLEEGGHMSAAWHLEQLPLSGRPIPQPQTVHDTFTNEVEDGWGDDPSAKWMVSTKIPRADFTAEKVADIVRQHTDQVLYPAGPDTVGQWVTGEDGSISFLSAGLR